MEKYCCHQNLHRAQTTGTTHTKISHSGGWRCSPASWLLTCVMLYFVRLLCRDKFWCFEETFRPFSPLCIRGLGTPYIFAVAFTQGWHSSVAAWQKIGQRMGLLALTTRTSSLHWQITAFHTSAKLHHCFHSVLHLDSIVWRLFQLSPSGFGAPKVARKDLLSRTLGARYPMKISDRDTFLALGPHYAAEEVCG